MLERVKVKKKTLKFLFKTFGRLKISYYFCTRKYESSTDRKDCFVIKREIKKIIDIQYNNQVRKN